MSTSRSRSSFAGICVPPKPTTEPRCGRAQASDFLPVMQPLCARIPHAREKVAGAPVVWRNMQPKRDIVARPSGRLVDGFRSWHKRQIGGCPPASHRRGGVMLNGRLRFALLAALALALHAIGTTASVAQQWPTRPVRFVLPFGPGSGADTGARLITEKLQQKWGQPV